MEILLVASVPLILLGIVYGLINLFRKKVLEATTWGLVGFIGFLLLVIAMQSMSLTHKDVKIISLKYQLKKIEKNLNKEDTLNSDSAIAKPE